jgi:hypothetical protein
MVPGTGHVSNSPVVLAYPCNLGSRAHNTRTIHSPKGARSVKLANTQAKLVWAPEGPRAKTKSWVGQASRPAAGLQTRLPRTRDRRGLEAPRTVENPQAETGFAPVLGRRKRLPHVAQALSPAWVFITIGGPKADWDRRGRLPHTNHRTRFFYRAAGLLAETAQAKAPAPRAFSLPDFCRGLLGRWD